MAESSNNLSPSSEDSALVPGQRVIRKARGRHLVYRKSHGSLWFLPHPYALISNIEGSLLAFYGIGQLWATHRKLRRINDWYVRVPRFISKRIISLIDELEPHIDDFIEAVEQLGIIGTLIIERRVIEFHWTVPGGSARTTDTEAHPDSVIDAHFNRLASAFEKVSQASVATS